ncbi:MAG: LuxR C-terminal-related transcriptional regulator [Propionicimonas sp.]
MAPAGFGKTSALSAWAAASPRRIAWMSLTTADRNPEHLARGLAMALDDLGPTPDEPVHTSSTLHEGRGPLKENFHVLVIDDVQLASAAGLRAVLTQLLDQAPGSLRIVVAGRQEPSLGLTKLMAKGELARLSLNDLAFSAAEVALAAATMGHRLTRTRATELHQLTNGWPVAVRLALMTWPSFETSLSTTLLMASEADIPQLADYLVENVIAQLPVSLRTFVPRACVCDWLTGRLASELVGSTNGPELLERALALGLPLERSGMLQGEPVYRWHPVMAQAGRAILLRRDPVLAIDLNLVAARFLAAVEPLEAASHALRGHDPELAATLIRAQWLEPVLRGDSDLIEDLCGRLPGRWAEDPQILSIRAACRRNAGDSQGAAELSRRASLAARSLDPEQVQGYELTNLLAGLLLADDSEDLADLSARAQRALAADIHLDGKLRACGTLLVGWIELRLRHMQLAVQFLRDAAQLCQAEGLDALADRARANHTYALAFAGDFISAGARLAKSSPDEQAARWRLTDGGIESYTKGYIRFWSGDPDGAFVAFHQAVEKVGGPTSFSRLARIGLLHAALARGDRRDIARAEVLMGDLPNETIQGMPWMVWKKVARAGILLSKGDPAAAAELLDTLGPEVLPVPAMIPLMAEFYWTCDRPVQARALAAMLPDDVPAYLRASKLVITALCDWLDGSTQTSHALLEDALELGSTFGLAGAFHVQDQRLDSLLTEHAAQGTRHGAFLASQLAYRRSRMHGLGPDPLSDREREILGYLATPLTAGEICEKLFISSNTLKTHLRAIYRKLGVDNRRDAVRMV